MATKRPTKKSQTTTALKHVGRWAVNYTLPFNLGTVGLYNFNDRTFSQRAGLEFRGGWLVFHETRLPYRLDASLAATYWPW